MKLALCGNPNVGKTTLFNRLTRSDAPVGNWHGVTVDVRVKRVFGEKDVTLCDLPGAYSLTARTSEEIITRDNILFGEYDAIVYVAEVNNLRRNLYFLAQLLESGKKTVLVVNMMDEAKGRVDLQLLSKRLGIPVVGASEKRENPKTEILNAVRSAAAPSTVPYASDGVVCGIARKYAATAQKHGFTPEFAALKILERDEYVSQAIGADSECAVREDACAASCSDCARKTHVDRDTPARLRYVYVDSVLDGVIEKNNAYALTEKIDRVMLGKLALPIFFCIMAAVFAITFEVGKPLSDLLIGLAEKASNPIRSADIPKWAGSLLCDGIISGVGTVLAFLPQVVLLFLLTAFLQDSGYMSRVAFVTDDFFKKFGLSGRAAFSLILGLGCSATAVLSTRGISEKHARKRTAFVTPFIPCSARLAVFTAMTAYFGLPAKAVVLLYVLGFASALVVLKVMRVFDKSDDAEKLLMEMPPYRLPSVKRVLKVVWSNVASFIVRVGSIVLAVSVIVWALSNFSIVHGFGGGETSLMCTLSGIVAPIFAPLGFGNWRAVTALLSGIAAKETVVSVIAALGGYDAVFGSTLGGVSFLIFTCLYVPCTATLAALAKENGIKSTLLSIVVHTVVAYVSALVFYQAAACYIADKRLFFTVLPCSLAAFVAVLAIVCAVAAKRRALRKNRTA